MARLLITGGSSFLGQYLVPIAAENHQLLYTYFSNDPLNESYGYRLDLRDLKAVEKLAREWQPETIIHLAGSNRSADMEHVITKGAAHIKAVSEELGCRLIHLSTDVVFDGRHGPYGEEDIPSPIHAYGRAKAQAESIISSHVNHVIIRTSLIYGLESIDHSTLWITKSLKQGQSVTLFDDQLRNPIWVKSLSLACLELIALTYKGVLNVAGRQSMSRAEFGLKLLDWWGFSDRQGLVIGPSSGQWPHDCRLNIARAESLLDTPLLGVDRVMQMIIRPGDS